MIRTQSHEKPHQVQSKCTPKRTTVLITIQERKIANLRRKVINLVETKNIYIYIQNLYEFFFETPIIQGWRQDLKLGGSFAIGCMRRL